MMTKIICGAIIKFVRKTDILERNMYLKSGFISFLKVKNIILLILGALLIMFGGFVLLSLRLTYIDDWNTFANAKATSPSVFNLILGFILLIGALVSRRAIFNAEFYSNYFEGDLDGYVTYEELADVTGMSASLVKLQFSVIRPIYMKNVRAIKRDNKRMLELYSKKALCQCRNCGAAIEKRVYFTGVCPYCQGSDLFARVLTDNRVYSISSSVSQGVRRPDFYTKKGLIGRIKGQIIVLCISLAILLINGFMAIDMIQKYNDEKYFTKLILQGKLRNNSVLLEKQGMMDTIIFALVIMAITLIPLCIMISRLRAAINANSCAKFFAKCKNPTVDLKLIPIRLTKDPKRIVKSIRRSIRLGYLKNCSIEKHGGTLQVMLAKHIVKDTCPNCGGPIVGAVNEHYQCPYCRKMLMGVVVKW